MELGFLGKKSVANIPVYQKSHGCDVRPQTQGFGGDGQLLFTKRGDTSGATEKKKPRLTEGAWKGFQKVSRRGGTVVVIGFDVIIGGLC